MGKLIDLTGQKFERLTVLKCSGRDNFRNKLWECKCECGNITTVTTSYLINSKVKSCGCYRAEKTKEKFTIHGLRDTRLYEIWNGIKRRCYDKRAINYKDYGGRGIAVCDEWRNDFKAFYDWAMVNGYKEELLANRKNKLTIDRIDVNGNYEPLNCRWVTNEEQANNKRTCHYITFNGETKTLKQWSEKTGISYRCLQQRITKLKWNAEKALNTPSKA